MSRIDDFDKVLGCIKWIGYVPAQVWERLNKEDRVFFAAYEPVESDYGLDIDGSTGVDFS